MKKTLLLILATLMLSATLLFTASCADSDPYPPVESTESEAQVLYTLTYGGKSYEVRYELYRALFLTYKPIVDGGDTEVWKDDRAAAATETVNKMILDRVSELYSVFAACEDIGVDLYSADVDSEVRELVRQSVEGGTHNGQAIEGYGSYEKYLAALKELNLNYSVQDLLYRYSIGIEKLEDHYIGSVKGDAGVEVVPGAIEYTVDDVKAFYNSDACVRVLRTYIQTAVTNDPEGRIQRVREAIVAAAEDGEEAVAIAMIANGSLIAESEVFNGYVIAKNNLDGAYFDKMTDAAFALGIGEVSQPILIHDGREEAYYLLYRAEKSNEHFEECYESIAYVYLKDKVGEIEKNISNELKESINATSAMDNIDPTKITME